MGSSQNKGSRKKGLHGLDARVAAKKKKLAALNDRLKLHGGQRRDRKGRFA